MKRVLTGVAALAIAIGTFSLLGRAAVQSVPSNAWSATADLSAARSVAASTLMYDGRVLVTGGLDGNGAATASAERYVPEGGAFLETPSMLQARAHHTSTLLPDGSVLVAGGVDGGGALASAEIYDPATNNWRPVAPMHVARSGHTATALYDGRVVIAGGDLHGTAISSIEIYDPWTERFERLTALLTAARAGHAAALAHDGMVVVAGGYDGANLLSSIDVIDPFFNTVASGPSLASGRAGLTATTLLDGKILLLGGLGASGELASGEIYDRVNNVVTPTANNMAVGRQGQQAILLPHNAQVLIVGGTNGGSAVPSAEVYVAWQGDGGTFFPANAPTATARAWTTAAALSFTPSLTIRTGPNDGLVLLAGGSASSSAGSPTRSSELYGFATVKTDLADYAPGTTVAITGGGWVSGESVELTLVEQQTGDVHVLQPVIADASGQIVSTEFAPDEGDLGIRFFLTATGSQSQAQTSFLDSNNFSVTPLTQTVLAGSTNTFVWTFTAQNGANVATTDFTIPAGWTAPQVGAGPGHVTITAGTCAASLNTISGMLVRINQAPGGCNNNTTFTLTYASATAPLTPAIYTFLNQHGEDPTVRVNAAPDLTAVKSNNVSSSTVFGQTWTWTVAVANTGTSGATFTSGQTILRDNLPHSNISYGPTSIVGITDVTNSGNIVCSIAGNDLNCIANGGTVTLGATTGAFSVQFSATPSATGTFANPRTAGVCAVDPSTVVTESNEADNACSNTVTVNKADQTITFDALGDKTYGDADFGVNATASSGLPVSFSSLTTPVCTVSAGTVHVVKTGTCTVRASQAGNDNYNAAPDVDRSFTVNQAPITVTATAGQFKMYGDGDPIYAYTITSGTLFGTDSFTGELGRVAGENVGFYAITLGSLAIGDGNGGNNYDLTFVAADFEIRTRAITVTATAGQFKIYGDADPTFAYTMSSGSLRPGDSFTGALSRVEGENVGFYAIARGSLVISDGNGGNNYDLTFVAADFEVKKRPITVTATAGQFKIYGDSDPTFAYTVSSGSLQGTDDFTGVLSRVDGENIGLYAITLGSLAIGDGNGGHNYDLTFVAADFEVKKRPITVTATAGHFKIYGDADPAFAYTVSGGPLQPGDSFTGVLSRVDGEDVGLYAITLGTLAISDGNSGHNYDLAFVAADFEVKKRPITVTADPKTKVYGHPDPALTYQVTGGPLQGTDGFIGALARAAGQNVGIYPINLGTLAINDGNGGNNYALGFVSANLQITARAITVAADPKSKVFGSPDPAFTYQITGGSLAFSDAFTGALTRDPGELVGTYAIEIGTLAINDGNGGNNYLRTFVGSQLTILTACSAFDGFMSPIGGSVENGNGGSFGTPVRSFKLNSTVPVKFSATCFGSPLTTGIHTLQAIKYSNATTASDPVDATPTDAATTGNQFRWSGAEWHFNLNTKTLGNGAQGVWLFRATLFDGSTYSVWVEIKK
jgi:hypothetical protein